MNDSLTNNDAGFGGNGNKLKLNSALSASDSSSSRVRPIGEFSLRSDMQSSNRDDSYRMSSEMALSDHLSSFGSNVYSDLNGANNSMGGYSNNMNFGLNERALGSVGHISPFSSVHIENNSMYSNRPLSSIFDCETTNEPFNGSSNLEMNNLQDVMEKDLYKANSTVQPMSSINSSASASIRNSTPPIPSFGLYSNNYNVGSMGKDLSPSFPMNYNYSNNMARSGNSTGVNNTYLVNNYGPFASHVSPQSTSMLPSFFGDPVNSEYHPIGEEISPKSFSTPIPSNPRLMIPTESPRLQRSYSSMTPPILTPPAAQSSTSLDTSMSNTSGFHTANSFKRRDTAKSNAWQNGDIESYRGHVQEMSKDHNGCRALQQSLDNNDSEVINMIYSEVNNDLYSLMMDPFGNYLFQKLLDVSTEEQRRNVLDHVHASLVNASLNVHGTRSVQHIIQTCNEEDMIKVIMNDLRGHIASLSSNSNGNHVIQRCLQCMPEKYRVDIYKEVVEACVTISTHRHGCCVVQRCLDSAPEEYHKKLLDVIVKNSVDLICNPFGNYVIQYLIEKGRPDESERITRCVLGQVSSLSRQKYSSNVIEKILIHATDRVRGEIIDELASSSDLGSLLHDKFANYVIQKALKEGSLQQQRRLLCAIKPYEDELSKSTGGRHISTQLHDVLKNE